MATRGKHGHGNAQICFSSSSCSSSVLLFDLAKNETHLSVPLDPQRPPCPICQACENYIPCLILLPSTSRCSGKGCAWKGCRSTQYDSVMTLFECQKVTIQMVQKD